MANGNADIVSEKEPVHVADLARIAISLTNADGGYVAVRHGAQFLSHTRFHGNAAIPWALDLTAEELADRQGEASGGKVREGEFLPWGVAQDAVRTPVRDHSGRVIGFIQLYKVDGTFTPEDHQNLGSLAALAAPALQESLVRGRLNDAEQLLDTLTAHMDVVAVQHQAIRRVLAGHSSIATPDNNGKAASAEQALLDYLRRSREQLATILQGVAEGIFVYDPAGRLLHVNDAGARILGFTSQDDLADLQFPQIADLVDVRDQEGNVVPLHELPSARVMEGLEPAEAILSVRSRSTDQERTLVVRSTPVLAEDGRLRFSVTIFTDITERLRLERLREEFLSMVTHELRSPLAVIKTAVALGREAPPHDQEEAVDLLSEIDAQADRLLTLVGSLLDMAQVEAGTFSVAPAPAPAALAVEEALARMPKAVVDRVRSYVAVDIPMLEIDVERIAQVLVNLLSNAEKFATPETPILLKATAEKDRVKIRVTNKGEGIPEDRIPQLFQKFSRLEPRRLGAGLGLAISRHIVEAHGGEIWVESSTEKQATTFSFWLPVPRRLSTSLPEGTD